MSDAFADIEVRRELACCIVTLNRPSVHNAISLRMMDELSAALAAAEREPSCVCLVITGAGAKTFCAGGDLTEFAALRTREAAEAMSLKLQELSRALRRSHLIIITALNGDAYGGGVEFALAADIRVAVENARLAFFQVTLGVTPAWRGIARALQQMPRSTAMLLCLGGEKVDAQTALRYGLIDTIAPPGQALEAALAIAQRIASHPPLAVRTIKAMIDAPRGDDDENLREEAEAFSAAWVSDDHWKAVAARKRR